MTATPVQTWCASRPSAPRLPDGSQDSLAEAGGKLEKPRGRVVVPEGMQGAGAFPEVHLGRAERRQRGWTGPAAGLLVTT